MLRIFTSLAIISLLLMLIAVMLGLSIGDLYHQPSPETLYARELHMLTGLAAVLGVVFVLSVVATYFVGTSRWCKEVVNAYHLDPKYAAGSASLKRRTFLLAVVGSLTMLAVAVLGAASDPETDRQGTGAMVPYHLAGALTGFAVISWTYCRAGLNIASNQKIVCQVIAQAETIRDQQGLADL